MIISTSEYVHAWVLIYPKAFPLFHQYATMENSSYTCTLTDILSIC